VLSVIVPATDSPPTLDLCVGAIRASIPPEAELLVQAEPAGSGPARARNQAAARARGEILVFVDSDVVVDPRALPGIEARFAAEPDLTAMFGSYDPYPSAPGLVSRFRNLLHHHVHAVSAGRVESFWAGLGAVRREAFDAAGGFDADRYPRPAIEDIELGCRLVDRGGHVVLDPRITGRHLKRWTLRSMVATDFARRGVPWTRLQLERRRRARGLNLSASQVLGAVAAVGIAVGAAGRRPGLVAGCAAAMVVSNASLYGLLARVGGPRLAAAGVPLQALHYLTAAASVPAGAVLHIADRRRG
jgi:Glycosyl transferase family 21